MAGERKEGRQKKIRANTTKVVQLAKWGLLMADRSRNVCAVATFAEALKGPETENLQLKQSDATAVGG